MNAPEPRRLAPPQLAQTSASGIDVPVRVGPEAVDPSRIGAPGAYPFTRGIFPDGYQGRLWTIRQYSGFGTAEESNERYRFLLEQGQTGLSVALDLPTQCGYDPIDPMARPEIGKVGVSLSNLSEAEILFGGIDLSAISTSFTINGTAAIIYAMYLAAADKSGVPRAKLTGTIQNDILKEYVARGTWIFPVRPSMRLIADTILYSNDVTPRFNPISIAGAHVRDAGATAVEEMAYTLANGLAYVDELKRRGGDVEKFAKRLLVLLLRAHGLLRRGRQVPRRPAALGAPHEGALRRDGPQGAALPLRRRVRRIVAGRRAAIQQHRAGRGRNDGGRDGRRAIDLHLRVRRGVPDPDRVLRRDRRAHPADRSPTRAESGAASIRWAAATSSSSTRTAWRRRSRR